MSDEVRPPPSGPPGAIASLAGAGKQFGGTWVVQDVDLALVGGSVLALCGENGAGKSTVVKMLAGIHAPDAGSVVVDGSPLRLHSPRDAARRGIQVIHQHPNLFPDLSVGENLFMAAPITTARGRPDRAAMRRTGQQVLDSLGVRLSVSRPVAGLALADQQLVEIAKALCADARALILDEPTAALSLREVDRLFTIVSRLRDEGVAVMLVNHRLDEVYAVADRITVLRDGRHIVTAPVEEIDQRATVRAMVGRELASEEASPRSVRAETAGPPLLDVRSLTREGVFADISFTVSAGEILGMAGLVGAGRTEIARVLFGIDRADSGQIFLDGQAAAPRSPVEAIARGLAYVPEDRHQSGVALDLSVRENLCLPLLRKISRGPFLDVRRERALVDTYVERLNIRTRSGETPVSALSGGNQQKVVISRWLATEPRVLILDEPTQGIDVGAKHEIHRIIRDLAAGGMAILLISSDMPELMTLAQRFVVVRDGRIVDRPDRGSATQESVLRSALGEVAA